MLQFHSRKEINFIQWISRMSYNESPFVAMAQFVVTPVFQARILNILSFICRIDIEGKVQL